MNPLGPLANIQKVEQTTFLSPKEFVNLTDKEQKAHLQKLKKDGELGIFINSWKESHTWENSKGKTLLAVVAELGYVDALDLF